MSCENIVDLYHTRGDTFVKSLSFADSAGAPIDLTGASVKFTVKKDYDDETALVEAAASIPSPLTWEATVTVTAAAMRTALPEVGNYVYDFQFTDSQSRVFTVCKGKFVNAFDVSSES